MPASTSAPHTRLRRLSALCAALFAGAGLSAPLAAADYVWLGQADTLWNTNNRTVGGTTYWNWSPSGPPTNYPASRVFIDNDPSRNSTVQIAPPYAITPSPYCTQRIDCAAFGGSATHLAIDAGDTLIIGGSAAFNDAINYSFGDARLIVSDPGGGGSLINNGTLRLSSDGRLALLGISGTVTLSGSGTTLLGNGYTNERATFNDSQIIYGASTDANTLVIAQGHTLRGAGKLGYNGNLAGGRLSVVNQGSVVADNAASFLMISGLPNGNPASPYSTLHSLVNRGDMRAENGSRIWITSAIDNAGGLIEARNASSIDLGAAVYGGTLRSTGSGRIYTDGTNGVATFLTGVTIEGRVEATSGNEMNFGWNGASSTITNNGTLAFGLAHPRDVSPTTYAKLRLYGDTLLAGTGRVEFSDDAGNVLDYYGNYIGRVPVLTLGAGQSFGGATRIRGAVVNQGLIEANTAVNPLLLDSSGSLVNEGRMVVSGSAPVGFQTNGQFRNQGELRIEAGSTFSGLMTQTAGTTTVMGTFAGNIILQGGVLKGTGSITGNVSNSGGIFAPGTSPGTLTLQNYTQTAGGELVLEIDGDAPSQRDHLIILGNASFYGGRIVIDLGDYTGTGAVSFADLLSVGGTLRLAHPVTGAGAVIDVIGLAPGRTAQASWNGSTLGLSIAAAVPEPSAYGLMLAGLGLIGLARRRSA